MKIHKIEKNYKIKEKLQKYTVKDSDN